MRTYIKINKENLRHNYLEIKSKTNKEIIAVVKGNAYGHGIKEISQELALSGCKFFMVASINEALQLRKSLILSPILLLENTSDLKSVLALKLTLSIMSLKQLEDISKTKIPLSIQLFFDLGMKRDGLLPYEALEAKKIISHSNLLLTGIFAHHTCKENYEKETNILTEILKIFDNKILDEDGNEIKVYTENTYKLKKGKTEKYYKKHPPKIAESFERTKAYDKYLEQEFNTSDLAEINYLSVKDNGTFFTLLQTKSFLDSLCEEAEKAIKDSKKYEEEYAIRLTRLIEKLKEYSEMIISKATLIELAIRDWRTRVMECSLKVLKAMPVEKVSEYNLKTRAFVLKSLLTTLDIGNSQANIIRFIANIIGTSEGTVKGYFIDFSKDNHGMKKKEAFQKEMENALNMCNLLSTESENKRYVIQLIDAIKKIKDAQK